MGSIALAKDGEIVYAKAVGFANLAEELKANLKSKYRIGSISKTFTAVMVLKAVEEGSLDLKQNIFPYFPSIENAKRITIHNLLNHRSGIHNFTQDPDYLSWNTEAKTQEQMLQLIAQGGSDFLPDTKGEYSNSNYLLLSYILEKNQGKSYADLLEEQIIVPLGLEDTYFGAAAQSEKNECKSYTFQNGWQLENETDMSIPMGAGGIVSTPSDLTRFSDALFAGELLKEESLAMMKMMKDDYGMALFQFPFGSQKGFGHTGSIDGFGSIFTHFPSQNISYALCSNGNNYNINDISITVLSAINGKEFSIPSFSVYEISSAELDKYLGIYSSADFPLKITITKDENSLIAQATGQASFALQASRKDEFRYDQAGVVLKFDPEASSLILLQGGGKYTFTLQKYTIELMA